MFVTGSCSAVCASDVGWEDGDHQVEQVFRHSGAWAALRTETALKETEIPVALGFLPVQLVFTLSCHRV